MLVLVITGYHLKNDNRGNMKNLINFIDKQIAEICLILPAQSPLEHFVHHNNLHSFESKNFEKTIESIFLTYGRSAYMPLSYFRGKIKDKEIRIENLKEKLKFNGFDITSNKLLNFIANNLYQYKDEDQINFYHSELMMMDVNNDSWIKMDKMAKELWMKIQSCTCKNGFDRTPDFHANRSIDKTSLLLIPFLTVLMDQGQAEYQLNDYQRENYWTTFITYLDAALSHSSFEKYIKLIPNNSNQVDKSLEAIYKDVSEKDCLLSIKQELHAIPGWSGMINKMEHNKEVIPRRDVSLRLKDYLLMRLIVNKILKVEKKLVHAPISSEILIRENVFNFMRIDTSLDIKYLMDLFYDLSPLKLRRIMQQAYEKSYQDLILSGIKSLPRESIKQGEHQMFFCIDDRECSFRRYLEELSDGNIQTYGVAGFFGLDMMYQKVGDTRGRRLCPSADVPQHFVKEVGETRKFKFARMLHYSHSSFIKSTVAGLLLTPWKALEFKLHLFAPRLKRKLTEKYKFTKLEKIEYLNTTSKPLNGLIQGYTYEELAAKVSDILKGAGLVNNFASYVYMMGHGHNSFNNPHVSAYSCGACSGANSYPNAKVFAKAANDPKVRSLLMSEHGITIPDSTYFIGGYHDTCNDDVELFDIEHNRMSADDQKKIEDLILKARQLNALERSKKFFQSPARLTPKKALKFVEERAWRIAEPRPELNHATDALCIVGRREVTKNLFLDRKAFLTSYDAKIDPDAQILAGLLAAIFPVCAGINLEYYFSKVDTENYGSGSKTSHNVTGLFGVMNGIRGDLRTGLVWQMVEYHDPLRLLFVVEASESHMKRVMEINEEVANLIQNYWINLALIDPDDQSAIKIYQDGKFVDFSIKEANIKSYNSSSEIPTGLKKPVHVAFIQGAKNG